MLDVARRLSNKSRIKSLSRDCIPFGAAALLSFNNFTLTSKQGMGIAVPYEKISGDNGQIW